MKRFFLLLLVALTFTATQAQKTVYDANAEVRTVKGFHAVQVSSGIDLYLTAGDEAVAVSASSTEMRNHIKTEVQNGVLKIWVEWKDSRSWMSGSKRLKAYVSYKTLDAVGASGGSDVSVEGTLNAQKFVIDISGGSDFKGKIAVQNLTIDQSGGADIDISGTAGNVQISASGGSDFNGYELTAETCNIQASGGSDVEITVNKELTANLSGASDLSYKGAGSVKAVNTSGSSRISKGLKSLF